MAKHFTRAEAEALLPRVEPLLLDLQRLARELVQTLEAMAVLQEKMRGNGHAHVGEYGRLHERSEELRAEAEAHAGELGELGIELKDIESGLIDFPALREGRTVYLCWRLGEGERIHWWHELDAGFAGRQPLEE
jgi:hypothetical protein